ncbi:SpoIVB peptidase [Halobacillus sp. A5]|uniref:SpoIVB peptidase n=1 Tax=Halobacillus sp. A5 TaxID=2880263 RepID=UPI0020A6CF8C|nr:SpoIVB peptidase [Halobacillus sp. A5]MCP3025738.1 SpoIVB peptidase [Halobacillus sp. A5]
MDNKQRMKYILGSMLLLMMLVIPLLSPLQEYISIPTELRLSSQTVNADADQDISVPAFSMDKQNTSNAIFHEYAGIPVKKTDMKRLKDIRLVPGGQSVGVELQTKGVLVVGHHLVSENKERQTSPGETGDIQVGDILLKGNGQELNHMEDLSAIVKDAGEQNKEIQFDVKRGEERFQTSIKPQINEAEEQYQIGLYVRDSAAGIGTMTFYDPNTKKYGALGHVIADMDTKKPIEIHEGTIVNSRVTSIQKGNQGVPGEKKAEFSLTDDRMGTITKNSSFGVFGELEHPIKNDKYKDGLPIALDDEIKEGPAKILTVLNGDELQSFDVEIIRNMPKDSPVTKGMIVKITDPELLDKTGGIVQGMSGSPIIQDDKIIGAVTHVFVNDPTSGYGVHIEWMMEEAGINIYEQEDKKAS